VTHVYRAGPSTHTIRASAADDVGTYQAGNTVTVTVDHVAPMLTISGAATVNEKATYTLHLSSSAPGAVTINEWTILWGDGAIQTVRGNPSAATHVYAVGPNTWNIMATATDPEGTYAAVNTVSVSVNHLPPTITIRGAASVNEGATYSLTLSGIDTHPISEWDINWDDGTVQTVTGDPTKVTHVYAQGPAKYIISATATDDLGIYDASNTVAVAVKHVPPKATIRGAGAVNEGTTYTLQLSAVVAANHTISQWTINWGDGSDVETVLGDTSSITHVYADSPNAFVIRASATDDAGAVGVSNTLAVKVNSVPPTLTLSGVSTIIANTLYTLELSSSEPGPDTIRSWTINWGDGSAIEIVTGNPSFVTHTYTKAGTQHVISGTATDEDGTYNSGDTVSVTVMGP
jgi:hypothetical protein